MSAVSAPEAAGETSVTQVRTRAAASEQESRKPSAKHAPPIWRQLSPPRVTRAHFEVALLVVTLRLSLLLSSPMPLVWQARK